MFDLRGDDLLWQELTAANPGPLPIAAVRGVFRQILSASRQKVKTHRVAYLGPQFSFTHLAAIERFGESADLIPVSTIASVFEEVNRGHADYGLVPIENSTDGRIVDTLDMFTRLPLRICGEVQIAVHHNLCSKSPRSEITEIYSKPQALSQCREWLSRNMPQARLIEVTSTSTAAQLARDKPGVGAVASRQAAVEYDLQVVAEKIEDNANNVTRFAVIGDQPNKPSGHDRTAVLLQIPHEPGSLSDALQSFKRNKLNLSWIESFPLRGPETGYLFFIDFEGHLNDGAPRRRSKSCRAGPSAWKCSVPTRGASRWNERTVSTQARGRQLEDEYDAGERRRVRAGDRSTCSRGSNRRRSPRLSAFSLSLRGGVGNRGIGRSARAQNVYHEPPGAFTGEVAVNMLIDVGCRFVIIGHSERRHILGETNALIQRKVLAAIAGGLDVVLCVGEQLAEREAHQTERVLDTQMAGGLAELTESGLEHLAIAYEPVWAIGTGRTATPEQAEDVHLYLRKWLADRYNSRRTETTRILYGGSVNPKNALELLSRPDIDGALVGGASLKVETFQPIIEAAAAATQGRGEKT